MPRRKLACRHPCAAERLRAQHARSGTVSFRWAYSNQGETSTLHLQSLQNDYWTVREVLPNVLQLTRPNNGIFLLFRIGSEEYLRIGEFIRCVTGNFDKALFKLDDCGDPPETGGGAAARGRTGWQ